jgi:hypothetical protein
MQMAPNIALIRRRPSSGLVAFAYKAIIGAKREGMPFGEDPGSDM